MSQTLEMQLEEGNGDARETARAMATGAIPVLKSYAGSESAQTRALALECFGAIGGDEAVTELVKGLEDPDINVRNKAVRLLHRIHSPAAIDGLKKALKDSPDEWVRGNAALILGKFDAADLLGVIKEQLEREPDLKAAGQMRLAIARLEAGEARQEVIQRLSHGNARERYDAIGDLEYLNKPELVSYLVPLFSDVAEVRNVGTEPFPVWHRVCDRAVEAVERLLSVELPFSTGGRNYSPEEIELVRQTVARKG